MHFEINTETPYWMSYWKKFTITALPRLMLTYCQKQSFIITIFPHIYSQLFNFKFLPCILSFIKPCFNQNSRFIQDQLSIHISTDPIFIALPYPLLDSGVFTAQYSKNMSNPIKQILNPHILSIKKSFHFLSDFIINTSFSCPILITFLQEERIFLRSSCLHIAFIALSIDSF